MIRTIAFALAALLPLAALAQAPLVVRLEMRAVDSVTLSGGQFLTGEEKGGKKVTLGGELRIPGPPGTKVPAVILVHGSGGISGATDAWARELNASASPPLSLTHSRGAASFRRWQTSRSSTRLR